MHRRALFLIAWVLSGGGVVMAVPAIAQQAAEGCEPGFERRLYPHGSEHNFRCRTRVIDCPGKPGHHVVAIPEPMFETAQGVQFGYRCNYTAQER